MSLNALSSRAIIGRYYKTLEAVTAATWVDRIASAFTSDQESETYKWLGQTPMLREWLGGRQAKGLKDNGITIDNKHYEATLDIQVEDIRRDKTSQIMARVDELAARGIEHWAKLLSTLILAGETTVCYDGDYFFGSAHAEESSGTQVNLLTGTQVPALDVTTATAPTVAEMEPAILDTIAYMMGYVDNQGEPMNANARSWLIMCPKGKIYASAIGAVKNEIINQSTSTLKNAGFNLEVVCNPRCTETDAFYVFRTDANVKALIQQTETEPVLQSIAEGSELEFNNGIWRFGLDCWRNVGFGYWQFATHCTLS